MINNFMTQFNHSFIIVLTLVLLSVGIILQAAIGIIYQQMINASDTLSGADNRLLKQCKERFVNCYKLNGGVSNISVFVDKFINRIRFLGMSTSFMKHLSGQLMLAGVFVAGFGVCKGIVEGRGFVNILPFYIISLFAIYLYLSIMSMVDMPARRKMLKTNLTDYLENIVAQRLEHGIVEKEKLLFELAQEKNTKTEKKEALQAATDSLTGKTSFSEEEQQELEDLLRAFMGNKA